MNESKRQTMLMIGVALIIIALIIAYVSLSSPRVYEAESVSVTRQNNTSTNEETSVTYPININTATLEELESINGIGELRAKDIIAYRQLVGKYKSVDEIKNIKGFGDGLYEQVAPYLTV